MVKYEKHALKKIRQFVKNKYKDQGLGKSNFHNFKCCQKAVQVAGIIAEAGKLTQEDLFVIYAAIWLKHIDYTESPENPELINTHIISHFLEQLKLTALVTERIKHLCLVNPVSSSPVNLIEEVFLDAQTSYLAKRSFLKVSEMQRKEFSEFQFRKVSKAEWIDHSLSWLDNHRYFTETARSLFENKKQRNITLMRGQLLDAKNELTVSKAVEYETPPAISFKRDKNFPEKGVDTMFRVALANNQRISALADNKARILITVNSIILSAVISLILKKLNEESFLAYPTFALVAVSLVSITLAILAIRPHDSAGKFTAAELDGNATNLLFFGNFHKMDLTDFKDSMFHMMEHKELVYGTLIQDLYEQGKSIGHKYHLLRIAYTIFMFGLIISVTAFIVATVSHYHGSFVLPAKSAFVIP